MNNQWSETKIFGWNLTIPFISLYTSRKTGYHGQAIDAQTSCYSPHERDKWVSTYFYWLTIAFIVQQLGTSVSILENKVVFFKLTKETYVHVPILPVQNTYNNNTNHMIQSSYGEFNPEWWKKR
jgi:hypothetical protein